MNRKAFELAISTFILIVLGILVLVALSFALTGGFKKFKSTSDPFLDTNEAAAVKQACSIACDQENLYAYCCIEHELNDEEIKCSDSRIEVSCEAFNCANFICEPPLPNYSKGR